MRKTTNLDSVMRVSDVMSTELVKAEGSTQLTEAVQRMLQRNVGCVLVTEKGRVRGIITKGDLLRKIFLKGVDAGKVSVEDVMTKPVVTIDFDSSLEQASNLMSEKGVSKLPVVKEEKLVGIITSTDIIRAEPAEVGYLQELIRARFVPHDLR